MPCKEYEIEHPKARNNAKCSFALRHVMVMMCMECLLCTLECVERDADGFPPCPAPFLQLINFFGYPAVQYRF